jgi:AAA15 family ATPase/GTPase
MHYSRIHVHNYKSFLNTGEIKILKGINLIIGQNNVGKTALLELLSGSVSSKPHLNKEQKPRQTTEIKNNGWNNCSQISVSPQELSHLVEDYADGDYIFLNKLGEYPSIGYTTRSEPHDHNDPETKMDEFEELVFHNGCDYSDIGEVENYLGKIIVNDLMINCLIWNKESSIDNVYSENVTTSSGNIECLIFKKNKISELRQISSSYEISKIITKEFFENRVYKFNIHRTIGAGKVGTNSSKLDANCTNLSSVLDAFQANPTKFLEYKALVQDIFPTIKDISIDKDRESPIRIWLAQSENRTDLTVSLDDCGTGIGQVLAMLYVIVNSDVPKVIIIDEPNSFLHPSASRKLVEIFKRYNQHQYIISTHSPELITAADADQILLLTLNEQGRTQVRAIDKKDNNGMRDILENIGSKLSDVFGYESILWVEGETEEKCFPLIVEKLLKKSLSKQAILKVRKTGDFESKHKKQVEIVFDLYERMVKGDALIPPASAFIFDKESRSQKEINDFKRLGTIVEKGKKIEKIYFLTRRLYENYLLNTDAITAILNKYSLKYEWNRAFEESEINAFFVDKKRDWDNAQLNSDNPSNWRNNIDAAKLLKDLFNHFSESKLEYRKTTHSKELTEWLIENAPHELEELKELLSKFY